MKTASDDEQLNNPHNFLAAIAGGWSGTTSLWLEPDAPAQEGRVQGSIQLILDGRFAIFMYQTSMNNNLQHGMFIFGYNVMIEQWEASWVDSFHTNTGMMFCAGKYIAQAFSVLGAYTDPSGGPDWGWRTELSLANPNHILLQAYNITPDGQEFKAIETSLERAR